nr:hypothetical protein [Tanacetum cinerariifolium]
AEKIARVANPFALVAQQQQVYHPQTHSTYYNQHSLTRTHQAATRNIGKAIVNSPQLIYDQEPSMEYGHVTRECQKPKRAKDAAYHREKMLLCKQEEAGIQLNAEQADWKDDTDDESDDQELEAHYMYMAKLQQVSLDAVDSGPIFDIEPEQKEEAGIQLNAKQAGWKDDTDDEYDDQELEAHYMYMAKIQEKLKCEIDETKNRNTLLETSNKVLVEKLKSEIKDFKNKNKSLKEANNKLSEKNDLMYADFKKSQAELKQRNSIEYASEMELECAKVRDLFLKRLNEEMIVDLRYFNSLELEVDSLTSQLETLKTQFVNEIDRLSREYYYAGHMNAILGFILN